MIGLTLLAAKLLRRVEVPDNKGTCVPGYARGDHTNLGARAYWPPRIIPTCPKKTAILRENAFEGGIKHPGIVTAIA